MDCIVKSGETAYVKPEGLLLSDGQVIPNWSENCQIQEGANIQIFLVENSKEEKQEVKQKIKENKVMPEVKDTDIPQAAPEASETVSTEAPTPEPKKEVEAITSVPDAPFDLNQVIQSTGGGAGAAVILAVVAVAGGGAAWKFYKQFAEQKHEQAMKKLELQAQAQGMNGAQPPPCAAQNAVIEGRLAAMETKLATVEKKSASFSADFDAEEIEERVIKLEKKVKTLSAKSTKGE
jgi:hypothetical protein